ncbi:MAG: OprO/OprP family phosphate-selective porin [Methylophaga sp.]
MKLKTTSLLIAGTLFGAAMMPAQANNEAMMDLLKVLRDQGTITAQNYDLLVNAAKADKEASEAVAQKVDKVEEKAEKAADTGVKITTKGKFKVEGDGWSFQPIGRVMYDYIDTDEDNSGSADFQGTELRRARLGFEGNIQDWGYKLEADFAKGGATADEVAIKDAFVSYGSNFGDTKVGVKLGQSHIAYGLNTKISSKYMSFMDRPWFADSVLSPARQSGVVAELAAKDYSWLLSAGYTIGEMSGGSTDKDAEGSTFSVRGSFVPYMQDKNHMLQIGAGYMNVSDDADTFKFERRLVSHKDHTKHLSTGTLANYDGSDAFTVDALGIFGSFHAMAEYNNYTADFTTGSDVDIDGYAIEAGYFLTGESLKWKNGYTSGIAPKSSAGAWQIAARFETLEIDGNTAATTDEADKWTVGVNYYPTQNTRLMLNYDKVTDLDKNGANASFEPSALKFRAQAYW